MIKKIKVIIALDTNNLDKAIYVARVMDKDIVFKIGMEFFYSFGYSGIEKIKKY